MTRYRKDLVEEDIEQYNLSDEDFGGLMDQLSVQPAGRQGRIDDAADYILDSPELEGFGESATHALERGGVVPPSAPLEEDRNRRIGAAVDHIASDDMLDNLGGLTDSALSELTAGHEFTPQQPAEPPDHDTDESEYDMDFSGEDPDSLMAEARTTKAPVSAPAEEVAETEAAALDDMSGDAPWEDGELPETTAAERPSPTFAMPQVDAEFLAGEPEQAPATEAPASGVVAKPAAPGPVDDGSDEALAEWDRRIQELEELQRNARGASEARAIGRLLTSAIATASRLVSRRGGARSYEQPVFAPTAQENHANGLIAERAGRWSHRDELRDRTALEGERLRQQQQEHDATGAWRKEQLAQQDEELEAERPTREARAADLQARTASTAAEVQREADEIDPRSGVSERSREEFRMSAATLPEDVQATFADRLSSLDQLSAREIDMLRSDIQRFAQGRLAQRTGPPRRAGSGGGGAAGVDAVAASAEARLRRLVERGTIDQATADRLMTGIRVQNPRTRREVEAQIDNLEGVHRTDRVRQAHGEGGTLVDDDGNATGPEILPGIRTSMDLERGEPREIRQVFSSFRASMGHLGAIRRLVEEHGGMRAFADPQIRAQIQRRLVPLRSMVTRIQETGIIQMGEREAIDAELPNPTQMTQQVFQTYMTNLEEWERIAMESAVVGLENAGILDHDRERAMALLRAPAGRATRGVGARQPARTGAGSAAPAPRQESPPGGGDVIVGRTAGGQTIRIYRSRLPEGSRGAIVDQLRAAAERRAREQGLGAVTWE